MIETILEAQNTFNDDTLEEMNENVDIENICEAIADECTNN
jgi:hypothetical protein